MTTNDKPEYEDELFSYELRNELEDALEADPPPEDEQRGVEVAATGRRFSLKETQQDCNLLAAAEAGHLMAAKIVAGWDDERREYVTFMVAELRKISAEEE